MSTPSSTAFGSRSFAGTSPRSFWSDLVAAMPIVIFWRALRQVLAR